MFLKSLLGFLAAKFGKYTVCRSLTFQSQADLRVTLQSIPNWLCVLRALRHSLVPLLPWGRGVFLGK